MTEKTEMTIPKTPAIGAETTALAAPMSGAPVAAMMSEDPIFGLLFDQQKFAQLQRVAGMFAQSGLVPDSFKNNIAACAVGLQLAIHMQVSPFMLFQKLYMVHGKPGVEAQFAIALCNSRGTFTGPIQYDWRGTKGKSDWTCVAKAQLSRSKVHVEMAIDWATVEAEGWLSKAGSKWKTMPEQMFRYRTAMLLIRTYAPEVLMGMTSRDELEDETVIDVTPKRDTGAADAIRTGGDVVVDTAPKKRAPRKATHDPEVPPEATPPATEPANTTDPNPAVESEDPAKAGHDAASDLSLQETPNDEGTLVELIAEAGLNVPEKKASLDVLLKQAGGQKPRDQWTTDEYAVAIKTLKLIVERNRQLAARRANNAAKTATETK